MKRSTVVGFVTALALSASPLLFVTSASAQSSNEPLSNNCETSTLPPHTGFQIAPACVSTHHGEVTTQEKNPSLLIVEAPATVKSGETFTIRVSTRNLVRDRFLAAGAGGYYKEMGILNGDGLTRGHFHTACRLIGNGKAALSPDRQFDTFVATEDGAGGATPDVVTVNIRGIKGRGEAQCASWAGDGSHRMPMMQFANQIPAFDAVRIKVN